MRPDSRVHLFCATQLFCTKKTCHVYRFVEHKRQQSHNTPAAWRRRTRELMPRKAAVYASSLTVLRVVLLCVATVSGYSQTNEETALNQVLKQMESVGKSFHSFTARFSQKKYTAVLKEFDTPQTGEFYYERSKDGTALLRQEVATLGSKRSYD